MDMLAPLLVLWSLIFEKSWAMITGSWAMITGVSGVLFGATVTFLFQRWKDQRDQKEKRYGTVLQAQMVLVYHINALINLKCSLLDPYRDDDRREMHMPVFVQMSNSLSVDVNALSFLVEVAPTQLILDIYLADRGYHNAADSVRVRNEAFIDLNANPSDCDSVSGRTQIEDSPRNRLKIKVLTDATTSMYECIDRALADNQRVLLELKTEGRKLFPGRNLVSFAVTTASQKD